MSFEMYGYPQVAVFKEKVYIGGGMEKKEQTVIVYDPHHDSYDTLPPYTYKYFSMGVVNNHQVVVGGSDVQTNQKTNKL